MGAVEACSTPISGQVAFVRLAANGISSQSLLSPDLRITRASIQIRAKNLEILQNSRSNLKIYIILETTDVAKEFNILTVRSLSED